MNFYSLWTAQNKVFEIQNPGCADVLISWSECIKVLDVFRFSD